MVIQIQTEETSSISLANDDQSEFVELYKDYFPRIYNYVHYRVDDFNAAEDLTSQIFEKLFSKLNSYQSDKAPLSAWIFSIARNAITDYYRSRKNTHFISLELAVEPVDSKLDPSDITVLNETQRHLRKALALLNQRERDIIALKFWGGFSNRDIAKLIGISESNTGVILFRAMRRLRIILESQGLSFYD